MKTLVFVAAALGLGTSPAFAGEVGPNPLPDVIAQAPVQYAPSIYKTPRENALRVDPARGPWLFPPIGKYLNQHAGG